MRNQGGDIMNIAAQDFVAQGPDSAFRFTGTWREYAPIAFTNLLLTLVTLGIYRFWARARERRYLWSRTEFIDDTLEWTGTGAEMFKGFLLVMVMFVPAVLIWQFGVEALILRGQAALAGALVVGLYVGFFFLIGVARYHALRYRLSRTYWHGIRGGGEAGGWGYGLSYLWKNAAGWFALALLVPWASTQLWNERWNRMSFGPHRFEAYADTDGLMGRWLLILVSPFVAVILMIPVLGILAAVGAGTEFVTPGAAKPPQWVMVAIGLTFLLLFYGVIALIGVGYFAAFARKIADNLELGDLRFRFTARSGDWLKLFLGHIGLVLVTLGIGLLFIGYRNWSFIVRHLEAHGNVDLDNFTQSQASAAGNAEGLASTFDIGAI